MKVAAWLRLCATAANHQGEARDQEPESGGSAAGTRGRDFAARTGVGDVALWPRPCGRLAGEQGIGRRVRLRIRLCFRGNVFRLRVSRGFPGVGFFVHFLLSLLLRRLFEEFAPVGAFLHLLSRLFVDECPVCLPAATEALIYRNQAADDVAAAGGVSLLLAEQ